MKTKKSTVPFILAIVICAFSLICCDKSSNFYLINHDSENSESKNDSFFEKDSSGITISSSNESIEYSSTNNADPMVTPIKGHTFSNFDSLVSYIRDVYLTKNKDSFFAVKPETMVETMGHSFSINYDNENEGVLTNPMVKELFYIYDENLGTLSDTTKDIPYYSMKFECLFYPVKYTSINENKVDVINITKTQVQIRYDNCFAANVTMRNLSQTEYALTYMKNNLIRL